MVRTIVAILIVGLSGAYAAELRAGRTVRAEIPDLTAIPHELGAWTSTDLPINEAEAAVLAADTQIERLYRRPDGAQVFLVIAYFAQQQVNSQIHSPRHCVPGGGWTIQSIEPEDVQLGNLVQPTTRMEIGNSRREGDVDLYYWFSTQAGTITGEYALKWDLVKSSLTRRPTNAAFVRFHGLARDRDAIIQLMADLDAPIRETLGSVGLR